MRQAVTSCCFTLVWWGHLAIWLSSCKQTRLTVEISVGSAPATACTNGSALTGKGEHVVLQFDMPQAADVKAG